MDEHARYNRERWEELAAAGVRYSRPALDLDPESARRLVDSARVGYEEARWELETADGSVRHVEGPREFRHTLSTVVNTLAGNGLVILGLWETCHEDGDPPGEVEPGSWDHFRKVAPPFLTIWSAKRPDAFTRE